MAEIITKDRKEYNIWDKINGVWNRLNFLTNAKSVDADDGKDLQTKVGAINGITSDLTGEAEDIAASIKCVNQLNSSLNTLGKPIKTKLITFSNISNSKSDSYYILLTDNTQEEIGDEVTEILNVMPHTWNGINRQLTADAVGNSLYLYFEHGYTFTNATCTLKIVYR